jgi:DNA polymerase III delta prime subunit
LPPFIIPVAELDRLNCVDDAAFNSNDTRTPCLPGTREEILEALREWVNDTEIRPVFWLNGPAGSGKSTIAQSFAKWLFEQQKLGGSFFCSRDSEKRSSIKAVFSTLAYQLATSTNPAAPTFRKSILQALDANSKIASLSLKNQLEELLVQPARESGMRTVVIIDALDECTDEETTRTMLEFLDNHVKDLPNVKFFITSRPETHIRAGFRKEGLKLVTDEMVLHEVATDSVDADIMIFLKTKLERSTVLADRSDISLPEEWPSKAQLEALMRRSGGLFIFASTVVKLILDVNGDPKSQLDSILNRRDNFVREGGVHLDQLYREILERVYRERDGPLIEERRAILGLLVVARHPMSATSIASLLGIKRAKNVMTCLRGLHSLLVIPDDPLRPIRFHHKSFPDFLNDRTRCIDLRFYIDTDKHHFAAVQGCFSVMNNQLKRNICGLKRYAKNDGLSPIKRDECIGESLRYSCRYWNKHLPNNSRRDERTQDTTARLLDNWLKTKLLQWFEALALLQDLGQAVEALNDVREWLALVRCRAGLRSTLLSDFSFRSTINLPRYTSL